MESPRRECVPAWAATLWHPSTHFDWVRPGVMLYGASPSGVAGDIATSGLEPAMTLASEIIGVQNLAAGDTVGYGSRFTADQPLKLGIVACGYADGYPRHAPTGTPVAVNGVRTRTIGRACSGMASALRMEPIGGVSMKVTSVCHPSRRGFRSASWRPA